MKKLLFFALVLTVMLSCEKENYEGVCYECVTNFKLNDNVWVDTAFVCNVSPAELDSHNKGVMSQNSKITSIECVYTDKNHSKPLK
jgi:hypothetical protein